jgi:hypothetical protein
MFFPSLLQFWRTGDQLFRMMTIADDWHNPLVDGRLVG